MIGLDTNVVVRYLVQDDPKQAAAATRLIEKACTQENPGFINRVVMCEMVWVLETAYQYPRGIIADVLERLLRATEIRIEDAETAWAALQVYRDKGIDFADALIGLTNRSHGCESTATFDKRAARMEMFSMPR